MVTAGAPQGALVVAPNGNLTIGNAGPIPTASLRVRRGNGTAKLLVQESSGTVAPRALMELRNNGPVDFTMINTNTG